MTERHLPTHVSCHDGKIVQACPDCLRQRALSCGWDVYDDDGQHYGIRLVKRIDGVMHIARLWTRREWAAMDPDVRLRFAGMEGD